MRARRYRTVCVLVLLAWASSSVGYCGEGGARAGLKHMFGLLAKYDSKGHGYPNWYVFLARSYSATELAPLITPHLDHQSDRVRFYMQYLLARLAQEPSSQDVRRTLVERLMACLEREGTRRLSPAGRIGRRLLRFSRDDFSDAAKEHLARRLRVEHESTHTLGWVILLVGVADMKSQIPALGKFLTGDMQYRGRWRDPGSPNWAALKARARMGVEEDIRKCIEMVESAPDPRRRIMNGLRDLTYIRRVEVVEYLRRYLEDRTTLVPAGGEEVVRRRGWAPQYAFYAAAALGEMIEGFPVNKSAPSYTEEDVETCRVWMAARKEYEIRPDAKVEDRALSDGERPEAEELDEGQRAALERLIAAYVGLLAEGGRLPGLRDTLAAAFGGDVLPVAEPYLRDPSPAVRSMAAISYATAASRLEETPVRREAFTRLVELLGGQGRTRSVSYPAYVCLVEGTAGDFTRSAREMLVRYVLHERPEDPRSLRELVLVVGVADIPSLLPELKITLYAEDSPQGSKEWWASPGWAAMKARARMGVDEDVKRCIELVEAEPIVNWRLQQRFGELSYVRRRRVVDYLRTYLDSDKSIHGRGIGAYADYGACQLAKMLRGFPVKKERGAYSSEDIESCREWMAAYDLIR